MKKIINDYLSDFLLIGGCLPILIGSYFVHPVLPWFVGGVELIAFGILTGAAGGKENVSNK